MNQTTTIKATNPYNVPIPNRGIGWRESAKYRMHFTIYVEGFYLKDYEIVKKKLLKDASKHGIDEKKFHKIFHNGKRMALENNLQLTNK